MEMRRYGITYDETNTDLAKWKKENCIRNIHLFDEVLSGKDHYLGCDACDLIVNIQSIDETYMDREVQKFIQKEKDK